MPDTPDKLDEKVQAIFSEIVGADRAKWLRRAAAIAPVTIRSKRSLLSRATCGKLGVIPGPLT